MEPESRTHILDAFDTALEALRQSAMSMATLTGGALGHARDGLFGRQDELCSRAIADDEEIDLLEMRIDQEGIRILLCYQPVASDLRQVVSSMKLSGNLERIADQAVSIARRARRLNRQPPLEEVELLQPMWDHAQAMFHDALQAFTERDEALAQGLKARDRELDALNREIGARLTERMAVAPDKIEGYLGLIFIARHLERVGDHAVNMGEDAVYAVAGRDIRHSSGKKE